MNAIIEQIPEFQSELDRIFKYWSTKGIHEQSRTFFGKIDHYGNADPKANKGIIMYTRQLWSFSAAAQHFNSHEYANIATECFNFLQKHFYDTEFGGYFWETNYEGNVIDSKKQTYAQAFALYALTEYYKLSNSQEVLNLVHLQFNCIQEKCFDSTYGGYMEGYTREWLFDKNNRLSEKDSFAEKSMNTNLHILEAYTAYYKEFKTIHGRDALKRIILDFSRFIIGADKHLILFMTKKWEQESVIYSYGHDIEASWLLWEAAEVLNDTVILDHLRSIIIQIVDAFVAEGIDSQFAVMNEYNVKENHYDTDRHWWPQCEAMEGLANAYHITADVKYLELLLRVWEYIKAFVVDNENGEWYTVVKENGVADSLENKGGMWKTPYHNGRALMRLVQRFSVSQTLK